jgi:cytochrome P450
MSPLHGLVTAGCDSAHTSNVRGGSPTVTGLPERPPMLAPRPRANRLLGFALELQRNQLRTYERAMREYGDIVRLIVGPPGLRFELTCAFHPDGVQRVLAGSREGYSKETPGYREIAAVIGQGLLTSEGQLWRRQRRLIQPLFTRKQITTYATLMAEEAGRTADRWDHAAVHGGSVDVHREMMRLTLRVVGRAVFGADVEHATHVIRRTFPVLTRHMLRRTLAPVAPPAAWPTPANLRAARAQRTLYALTDDLITQRTSAGLGGEDLLSRLLEARDPNTGMAMEIQQVRDEALIFLLAGHETTSSALTFTLQLLARHPDEQQRIAYELADVLGSRPPTVDDLPALRRTAMVLKEAMRLYPPVYALARRAEREDEIGGCRIPPGSLLVVSQWATHRHPRIWEDPETFNPDRFTPDQEAARHRYAYFPFGAGPRACLGSHFAMQEAQIALAVLLQRFRLHAPLAPVPLDAAGITLRPKHAVPIELAPRSATRARRQPAIRHKPGPPRASRGWAQPTATVTHARRHARPTIRGDP